MAKLKIINDQQAAPLDLFSYAALTREDEAAAREDAALIRSHVEDIAKKGIEIGQALNRQKGRMAHGTFQAWIRDECQMSERVAQRMMRVAKGIAAKAPTSAGLLTDRLGMDALDLIVSDTTPQGVRDQVEALLVDGQKVTVADIRRMKAEAKASQGAVESLTARNGELAAKAKAKAPVAPVVDVEAIRAEAIAEAENRLKNRIDELSRANVAANAEIKLLRQKPDDAPAQADANNIVRPTFGGWSDEARADDEDEYPANSEESMSAFGGALASMHGLEFSPADFWKRVGKKGTHGRKMYEALLSVNAIIGLLIKEHAK